MRELGLNYEVFGEDFLHAVTKMLRYPQIKEKNAEISTDQRKKIKIMAWTPCPAPIVADVIRWTEPIWAPSRKRRGKPNKIGEQLVTAEVIALGEYLQLYVRAVEDVTVKTDGSIRDQLKLKIGESIKRKKLTIERGKTERLLWSDEDVREILISSK